MSDTEGALLPKEDAKVSEEQTPETPTQDQNNATDPAMDLIDQTMAFLVRFASHEGFDRLRNLLQENGDLLLKLDKMEIAYHENLAQLGKTTLVLEDTKAQYDRELEAEKQAKEEALGGKASVEEDLEKRREELSQKAEEVVKHMEDIQDLRGQLEQRDETIRTLEGVQADRDELRTKLSETEQAIATKTSELEDANETVETLNSFMVDLRDPDDAKPHM